MTMQTLAAAGGGGDPTPADGVALYCARGECPPEYACDCAGESVCAKEAPAVDGSLAALACIGEVDEASGLCECAVLSGRGGRGGVPALVPLY